MAVSPWFRGVIRSAGMSWFTVNSTVGATMKWQGHQVVQSTGASKTFFLRAPKNIGDTVSVYCKKGTTTNTAWVVLPTGYSFQKTSNSTGATFRKAIMNAGNQSVTLVAISTAKVHILSNVNSVTITTS